MNSVVETFQVVPLGVRIEVLTYSLPSGQTTSEQSIIAFRCTEGLKFLSKHHQLPLLLKNVISETKLTLSKLTLTKISNTISNGDQSEVAARMT